MNLSCGKFFRSLILIVVSGLLAGCGGGGGGADRPDRTPVTGTVTFAGAPVSDAIVVFSPAVEGEGRGSTGITDSNGNFVMGTFEKADGVVPGDYIVLVSKLEQQESSVNAVDENDPAYNGEPTPKQLETEAKNLLPVAFSKRESSELKTTVGTEPVEGLKFDLGS
ncbi:MAG: carboxypeptidase regulatory-like domain-containing protein [Planctomycetaceae bacterium]|nr:carboxypeptidase regulatory-like domain-containing protein [Planctomycetaceae bacterium]